MKGRAPKRDQAGYGMRCGVGKGGKGVMGPKMAKPWHRTDGRTTTERGYGAAWQRLRLIILRRDGYLCQCPECRGGAKRLTAATEVDHIKPKADGGTDDPSNLRAVNSECHTRITMRQKGHTPRPKPAIGLDGWPIGGGGG